MSNIFLISTAYEDTSTILFSWRSHLTKKRGLKNVTKLRELPMFLSKKKDQKDRKQPEVVNNEDLTPCGLGKTLADLPA
jgi:hypothetical protein